MSHSLQRVHSDRQYYQFVRIVYSVPNFQCRGWTVSMEAGRVRRYRDDKHRLPTLSLGLSSVRLIVNKIESEYARVASDTFESGRELVTYDPNVEINDDSSLGPSRDRVCGRFFANLGFALSKCIPSVTFGNFSIVAILIGFFAPKMISYLVLYPFCRLVFGTLYPAYASYKAVRTKNLKEYVKWMMYWIVFALFTCMETFTDVFLSWFPFYYEVKIVLVIWLLSPATKGSSILYRKFVHPALCRREQEIDEYIAKAKDQGYHTVLNLGTKGVNYATTVIMQTAIKGGGGLVQQIRKSYSLSDLTECDTRDERAADEADDVLGEAKIIRRVAKSVFNTRRSASESNSRTPMYFAEVDVDVGGPRTGRTDEPDFSHIKSTEDISSGYSSADNSASLTRAGSVGAGSVGARVRARSTRTTITTIKRPHAAEDNEVIIEELPDDDTIEYANMPPLVLPSHLFLSDTDPPFIYQNVGDQIKIVQVLGNYPLGININQTNKDQRDQDHNNNHKSKDTSDKESTQEVFQNVEDDLVKDDNQVSHGLVSKANNKSNEFVNANKVTDTLPKINDQEIVIERKDPIVNIEKETEESKDEAITTEDRANTSTDDKGDATSLDTSAYENDSEESDDEASFGTPDNSPRSKRKSKSPKGKYGKGKAPQPPPKVDKSELTPDTKTTDVIFDTSQESLNDIWNTLPSIPFKETGPYQGLQVVNPIAEKKRRHKSKSPGRISRGNTSGIGKLLQLPSKLAFWHKNDNDKNKTDTTSTSSRSQSHSRTSPAKEQPLEDFQSCADFNASFKNTIEQMQTKTDIADDQLSFADAADFENEVITHDIMEKSDALQKLIEAKIESHPEYKFVSLHDEIPTTSKSTDV